MTTYDDNRSKVLDSLSAMFDDEASEEDLQRLLQEESLEEEMRAFHLIQQSLHKESELDIGINKSLVQSVRAQIDLEDHQDDMHAVQSRHSENKHIISDRPQDRQSNVLSMSRFRRFLPSFAMAASVAFVVILGGNILLSPSVDHAQPRVAQQTHVDSVKPVTSLAELNKHPLDADSIRLQNYLRQHAEQATMSAGQGMIPMARLASYPTEE